MPDDAGQPAGDVAVETAAPPAEGPAAAAAPASEPQAAPATDDSADFVRVARRNFAKYAPDGDFNKVIAMAKRAQELEQGGYFSLADHCGKTGMNGFALQGLLMQDQDDEQAPTQPAAAGAPAQPAMQPGQPAGAESGYLTHAQAQQMVEQAISQFGQQRDQRDETYRDNERRTQEQQAAADAEEKAYTDQLGQLGFKENPQTVQIEGDDHELDVEFRFNVLPRLQATAQYLWKRSLNESDPQYHDKLWGPIPPEIVARAAAILKPHLSLSAQQALENAADKQAIMPQASLAGGPGGRAQPKPGDLTPDQAREQAFARQRAAGTVHAEANR